MQLRPIYTEPENCQDCYKCIRECPVKAIRIEDNKAYIIEERCIYCGHCTQICPTGAKKIRNGIPRAKILLQQESKVILSLAPSYISEFADIPTRNLLSAIKQLGFMGVSETALGAELVSAHVNDFLQKAPKGVYISSACPVVVEYIRKYSQEHLSAITPVLSPMLAHAKLLKQHYGDDTKIIFAGPCISKKLEADNFQDLVGVAITFRDLKGWFEAEGIDIYQPVKEEFGFIPYKAKNGALYPVEGGMIAGLTGENKKIAKMSFSGTENIKDVLKNLNAGQQDATLFLELLSCQGGCINGPAQLSASSLATKKYRVIDKSEPAFPDIRPDTPDISVTYKVDSNIKTNSYSEEEIKQALAVVGKTSPKDELNCSGCGYDSCRDFAKALLDGRAEENMCVSYMRKIAHDKATVLLQKIPAGVILVSPGPKIMDMNRYCATLLGEETTLVYDASPGLHGVNLDSICNFAGMFATALSSGQEIVEKQIREGDKIWLLSIYNIQPHRQVFGLLQDLRELYGRKEWIIEKARDVVRKHMETVQQVACLLGENAAYSDTTLRAIMETVKGKEQEDARATEDKNA